MLRNIRKHVGQSAPEYMILVIFIMAGLILFQKYIMRSLAGRWKQAGDGLGAGRLYDPEHSRQCAYDYMYSNLWYDYRCYELTCDCLSGLSNKTTCEDCIQVCVTPECNVL
ncbi:MAG: hypothetical protein KC713_00515 [Candidatus Omnitrophica bacterium]|nr:hypothetical protein [Candidatus Omnitrophota bacterium]